MEFKILQTNIERVFKIEMYGINVRLGAVVELQEGQSLQDAWDYVHGEALEWKTKNIQPEKIDITLPTRIRTLSKSSEEEMEFVAEQEQEEYDAVEGRITEEFEALKKVLIDAPTKVMAEALLKKTDYRYNIELKNIINGKVNQPESGNNIS